MIWHNTVTLMEQDTASLTVADNASKFLLGICYLPGATVGGEPRYGGMGLVLTRAEVVAIHEKLGAYLAAQEVKVP